MLIFWVLVYLIFDVLDKCQKQIHTTKTKQRFEESKQRLAATDLAGEYRLCCETWERLSDKQEKLAKIVGDDAAWEEIKKEARDLISVNPEAVRILDDRNLTPRQYVDWAIVFYGRITNITNGKHCYASHHVGGFEELPTDNSYLNPHGNETGMTDPTQSTDVIWPRVGYRLWGVEGLDSRRFERYANYREYYPEYFEHMKKWDEKHNDALRRYQSAQC